MESELHRGLEDACKALQVLGILIAMIGMIGGVMIYKDIDWILVGFAVLGSVTVGLLIFVIGGAILVLLEIRSR
jgi:hypothetical protein